MRLYQPTVKLMDLLVTQQQEANALIIPPVFVTNVHKKILKFILSQKEPDYMGAFRIFRTETNREECLEYLRATLKNNSQKIALSTFSEMYNIYMGNLGTIANERENRLKFYYYSELCKYDQSLRFESNFDNLKINDLLRNLENRQLNVELLKKLSKDFAWDYQKALIQQIKITLRTQELVFDIKTDVFGKEEVVIKSSVEAIRKSCAPYLSEITNSSLLASEMTGFIKEINFYFYEIYLVVLELIEYHKDLSMDQKLWRHILFLLKHKLTSKRRRTDQKEVDCWNKHHQDTTALPSISKYRLPFKPIMEESPEAFLSEDLNVETFEKCIPLISMHASYAKVPIDDRLENCGSQAIKNSIMELKAKMEMSTTSVWNLKPTNNAFLQSVLRMVSLIKNKSKQMAMMYFYVNHSPEGSDQVEAAYECWKFVIANEQELMSVSKYAEIAEKIKRKYPLLKTQHLLHLYGLNDEKLLQLVERPHDLINALYHHESILQVQKKDINKLCIELSELFSIDLLSLQHKLLEKWLSFAGSSIYAESDINETVYEDFIGSSQTDHVHLVTDDNVVRAHYILSSWENNSALDFLVGELGSVQGDAENQLHLYECFAKLIDNNCASHVDLIDTNKYLLAKSCHFLKQLGIQVKPEKFKDMDKVDILKKLWLSHHSNTKGLEVMSFICLGFNVHLPQVWNGILKQMVALKMVSDKFKTNENSIIMISL
jgi:kinetochore-associated protein 1